METFCWKVVLDENELSQLADHFSQPLPEYKFVCIDWYGFWGSEQKKISNAISHCRVHKISQTDLEGKLWSILGRNIQSIVMLRL